jgi:membrane fusion protein (multidrug efflux system)
VPPTIEIITMRNLITEFTIAWSGMLAAGLLCGCDQSTAETPKPTVPPVAVQVTQPKRGPITRSVTLPAVIRADQQVTLYAKVAGYVKSIAVDRGDAVKTGDVLAEIEAPELLADQTKYQAEAVVAQLDYERLKEAQKKAPDLVVPLTVDTAKGKHVIALASLKRNETLLGYMKIIAPFSGTITKRWADVGALIPAATSSSSPQSAAVVTLMDASKVRIEVAVPAQEAPLVKKELEVEVTVDELVGKVFKGKVTRFAEALDDTTRTMATEIELSNATRELRAGMFATVKLDIDYKPDALLIPADALVVEKARTSVFTFVDGKAKKVSVKVGFEDGKSVEMLDGITGGETVILTGKLALNDGQSVRMAEAK